MHLMASLGFLGIKWISTSSMRKFPIISTPSSTDPKVRSEVKTQLLFPFMLSLLPATKFLLPFTVFYEPRITLLYSLNISLILDKNRETAMHLLYSSFFFPKPKYDSNEHLLMGLLTVIIDLSLFLLKKVCKSPNNFRGFPNKLNPPKFKIPPILLSFLLLFSEQSNYQFNVALRSLIAFVVSMASF